MRRAFLTPQGHSDSRPVAVRTLRKKADVSEESCSSRILLFTISSLVSSRGVQNKGMLVVRVEGGKAVSALAPGPSGGRIVEKHPSGPPLFADDQFRG